MTRAAVALAVLTVLGSGCATRPALAPEHPPNPNRSSSRAAVTLSHGDPDVDHVSGGDSFTTSSYWIEGPTGLILIDTQFLLSAATEFVDWAERATGKKALLAVVLHPNPDKFNGTDVLKARGIRVVTSTQVAALIPSVHQDRHYWFYDRYKPDYPDQAPRPESFGDHDTVLEAGGTRVTLHVVGAGASEAHVVAEWGKHVFVGDLVANLHHSWLEIGKTGEWLKRLAEIRALNPEFVHPGRGPDGGPELLDREEAYLRHVTLLVRQAHPTGDSEDHEARIDKIRARVEADYPGYGNAFFLNIGLPAEWDRQARRKAEPESR